MAPFKFILRALISRAQGFGLNALAIARTSREQRMHRLYASFVQFPLVTRGAISCLRLIAQLAAELGKAWSLPFLGAVLT